jgi:hypothetical protein
VIGPDATRGLRLALEALNGVDVGGGAGVQDLDGYAAVDTYVLALVDGAHPTFAEQPDNPILTFDDLAGLEGHASF